MFRAHLEQPQNAEKKFLTSHTVTPRECKSQIQAHLQEKDLGNLVLQFSKKPNHKRLHRKHQKFVNSMTNSHDEESSSSFDYAKSAEEKPFERGFSIEPILSSTVTQEDIYGKVLNQMEPLSILLPSRGSEPHTFRRLVSDKSTTTKTAITLHHETRQNSRHIVRKSQESFNIKSTHEERPNNNPSLLKVTDIDESFQIMEVDKQNFLHDLENFEGNNVVLEESMINSVSKDLREKLESYLGNQPVRAQEERFKQRMLPGSRMKLIKSQRSPGITSNVRLVRDSLTHFVMEEHKFSNYFTAPNKYPEVYWTRLLSNTISLLSLYGMQKVGNDLMVYKQVLLEKSNNLKSLLYSNILDRSAIPSIIRQVLGFITHIRKFDVLHGGIIPENINCIKVRNQLLIKINDLSTCSKFSAKKCDQNKRLCRYYPALYERNCYLIPDLMALCLLTLQLYTRTQPTVQQVLSHLENDRIPSSWSQLPQKAYDFMRLIVGVIKNNREAQNLQQILTHQFVWEAEPGSLELLVS